MNDLCLIILSLLFPNSKPRDHRVWNFYLGLLMYGSLLGFNIAQYESSVCNFTLMRMTKMLLPIMGKSRSNSLMIRYFVLALFNTILSHLYFELVIHSLQRKCINIYINIVNTAKSCFCLKFTADVLSTHLHKCCFCFTYTIYNVSAPI